MELKTVVDDICFIIDGDRAFYNDSQKKLREYVTNKDYPLEDRFKVWSEYCEKKNKGWLVHESEFFALGKIIDDQTLFAKYWCENRGATHTWKDCLDGIIDNFDDEDDKEEVLKYVSSIEEFKEILIETNFGSFVYDW